MVVGLKLCIWVELVNAELHCSVRTQLFVFGDAQQSIPVSLILKDMGSLQESQEKEECDRMKLES